MLKITSAMFTTLFMIFTSCSSSNESKDIRLHDIWALDSIEGEKVNIDENVSNLPVLEIYVEEERIHGNTGCNVLNGSVDIDENKISFSRMITTEMACPGDLEQNFLSALQKVNKYKIEKLRLYLFKDEKELLTFRKID